MKINFKGEILEMEVKNCKGLAMGRGLMFRLRKNARALLFELDRENNLALTSLFVFFPFLAVWLDEKNNVVDLKIVKPFTPVINSQKSFKKIVEIPLSDKYRREIELLCS